MKKIVAIMPIKTNNERLPGKNTKLIGNVPLLQHQLKALKGAGIDDIYVYCSDEQIKDFLFDGVKFLTRDKQLDLPSSNFSQIFASFMSEIDADIYIYAHATAPFVKIETIKECVEKVLDSEYDSAFCAVRIQDFLWKDGKPLNFDASNIPRSQDLDIIYRETSGVYVFEKEVFEKYHRRVGVMPYVKEVTLKEAIDINTMEDYIFADAMASVEL